MSTFDDFMIGQAVSSGEELRRTQNELRGVKAQCDELRNALKNAHSEIHNPGSGRAMGLDIDAIISAALSRVTL